MHQANGMVSGFFVPKKNTPRHHLLKYEAGKYWRLLDRLRHVGYRHSHASSKLHARC